MSLLDTIYTSPNTENVIGEEMQPHRKFDTNLPPMPVADTAMSVQMFTDATGTTQPINCRLIGSSTSYMPTHNHATGHGPDRVKGHKCSRCRWFEIQIFKAYDDYIVWTLGRSDIPGERTHYRLVRTPSAWEVVEILTVRQNNGDGDAQAFLPVPSARALAMAAAYDKPIEKAYVNRAVA